jgi:hypothetical protein
VNPVSQKDLNPAQSTHIYCYRNTQRVLNLIFYSWFQPRERVATANITEGGKIIIKSELQSRYPDYNPVATPPNMLDYNIDAVAKEISQDK